MIHGWRFSSLSSGSQNCDHAGQSRVLPVLIRRTMIVVRRYSRTMEKRAAQEPVTREPAEADEPPREETRLRVRMPPALRALWIILGPGTTLVLLVGSRPFRDLSWSTNLFLGLVLAVVLSLCAWFALKGVYLLLRVSHDTNDDALIAGVIAVAGLVMIGTVVLTCIWAESVRIKYKMLYAPAVREIHDDLDKLREGMTLEQYQSMVKGFSGALKRMQKRLKNQDPPLIDSLKSALDNLMNAQEHWSKLTDLEGASPNSLGSAYEEFARIKGQLIESRTREWDSFRTSCHKALAFMDDRTR